MKKLTESEVVAMLRKAQEKAGLSANRFAREVLEVTPPYLSEVYKGTRRPGENILAHLGLERHEITETYYTPIKRRQEK